MLYRIQPEGGVSSNVVRLNQLKPCSSPQTLEETGPPTGGVKEQAAASSVWPKRRGERSRNKSSWVFWRSPGPAVEGADMPSASIEPVGDAPGGAGLLADAVALRPAPLLPAAGVTFLPAAGMPRLSATKRPCLPAASAAGPPLLPATWPPLLPAAGSSLLPAARAHPLLAARAPPLPAAGSSLLPADGSSLPPVAGSLPAAGSSLLPASGEPSLPASSAAEAPCLPASSADGALHLSSLPKLLLLEAWVSWSAFGDPPFGRGIMSCHRQDSGMSQFL